MSSIYYGPQAGELADRGETGRRRHVCDDGCVCPVHGTPLIYWPHGDDHACQDITCVHGHGMHDW